MRARTLILCLWLGACANQTTFHTTPNDARVYINGEPCGGAPCVMHSRYGFPDRIRVQIEREGYRSAEFFLDTQPPLPSYALWIFGSYLFHTYPEEYRFKLTPLPAAAIGSAPRFARCAAP